MLSRCKYVGPVFHFKCAIFFSLFAPHKDVALAYQGTMLADLLTEKRRCIPNFKRSGSPRLNATFPEVRRKSCLKFAGTNTPWEKLAR
jgi:hypothetical protein